MNLQPLAVDGTRDIRLDYCRREHAREEESESEDSGPFSAYPFFSLGCWKT